MFSAEVRTGLEPLFTRVYDNAEAKSGEIEQVASFLKETAERLLPCVQPRRKTKWRDNILSCLCAQSRQAHAAWKNAVSPMEGPLYDEENRLRRAVGSRITRWCAARSERLRMISCLLLGIAGDTRPQRKKSRCSKLIVGGRDRAGP